MAKVFFSSWNGTIVDERNKTAADRRDLSQLKEWIVRRRLQGCSVTEICASAQISRDMFYRWWNCYQAEGKDGLREKTRGRPKGADIDRSLRKRVIDLRKRCGWGPSKIAGCLKRRGCAIDHNQAYRITCEAGLNHPITAPRKTWDKAFPEGKL